MRICFVVAHLDSQAGLGRMVRSITDRLEDRGHRVGFVLGGGESNSTTLVVGFRLALKRIPHIFSDLMKMRSFLKKYDVVVSFDAQPAGILTFLATLGLKKVSIIHALGTYALFPPHSRIKSWFMGLAYAKASRVFVINDFVKRKIESSRQDFSFGSNVSTVPVGVDTSFFAHSNNSAELPFDNYIISVGGLKHRKGQFDSIKAFLLIADIYPDLHYVLVGSKTHTPSYYDSIIKYLEGNKLSDRIVFLESVSDDQLIRLYSNAKFFVLTPRSTNKALEGFGMVYLEAALCGITSIGTMNSGAEEAIVNEQTGILVEHDPQKIADAMKVLLEDGNLREQYAGAAKQRALTFDWEHVVDLYEAEIIKLMKN